MTDPSKEDKIHQIAEHLRCPAGSKGEEMADMMNHTNAQMIQRTIASLDLQKGQEVLEIGPGKAFHLPWLFQKNAQIRYNALEISDTMKAVSEDLNASYITEGKATFQLYDGQHIPFAHAVFDCIYTINTLYFWPDPVDFLRQLKRILKPDGRITITFAQKDFMQTLPFTSYGFTLYDTTDVEALAIQVGLRVQAIQDYTESVISKTGDPVERPYTLVHLKHDL